MQEVGFRIKGSGCRIQGSGHRVQGAWFRFQGAGFRVQGPGHNTPPPPSSPPGFRVQGPRYRNLFSHLLSRHFPSRLRGSGFMIYDSGSRDQGLEFKVQSL